MRNLKVNLIQLIFLSSVFFSSCGTRKMDLEKTSFSVKSSTETSSSLEIKERYLSNSQNDITEENVETETTEKFDSKGNLIERNTKKKSGNKTDKSKNNTENQVDKKSDTQIVNKADSSGKAKAKHVDANTTVVKNVGGPGVVIFIALAVILACFIGWYIKRKNV